MIYSWQSIDVDHLRQRILELPALLRPRPNSGHVLLDIFFIVLLLAFQTSMIPSIFGPYVVIDLLTPWAVVTMIQQTSLRSFFLAAVAAFLLEARLAAPAGLYLSTYLSIFCVVTNLKDPLSWRHETSWHTIMFLSCLWVTVVEFLSIALVQGEFSIDWSLLGVGVTRLTLSVGFGLWLCSKQIRANEKDIHS